jgi:predicted ATPase
VVVADRGRAAECGTEAAALARERGFRQLAAMSDVVAGWATADADEIRRALDDFEASGLRMLLHLFLGLLADVEQRHGRHTEALESVERALCESEATGERFWEADLHRLRAELLLAGPPEDAARAHGSFERALTLARSQGALALEMRVAESVRRSLV